LGILKPAGPPRRSPFTGTVGLPRGRHLASLEEGSLSNKRVLTEQEKTEEIRMKKEKLFLKDRLAAIEREHAAAVDS